MNQFADGVANALKHGLPDGNDLAFLSLTGKIETAVRDAVAIHMQKNFASYWVCREQKRCDLVLMNQKGAVVVCIEFKDAVAGDLLYCIHDKPRYINLVLRDLEKSSKKFEDFPEAQHLAVLTVATQHGKLQADHGVKYLRGRHGHEAWSGSDLDWKTKECDRVVKRHLNVLAQGYKQGESRGATVRIDWWLIDAPALV